MRSLSAAVVAAVSLGPPSPSPCVAFDALYAQIRDGGIDRAVALDRVRELLPQIRDYYAAHAPADPPRPWRFPLDGYGRESIGGKNGSGYQPAGYDWFDGYRSKGHPGHDLFIHDRDQHELDDVTGKPVAILSIADGVVVAEATDWDPASRLRGGRYAYVFSPAAGGMFYYAHAHSIVVKVGEIVRAGETIGTVGRSGRHAAERRSPTHLHVMFLAVGDDGHPRPRDIYADLLRLAHK